MFNIALFWDQKFEQILFCEENETIMNIEGRNNSGTGNSLLQEGIWSRNPQAAAPQKTPGLQHHGPVLRLGLVARFCLYSLQWKVR
jgi:hypothetical protein